MMLRSHPPSQIKYRPICNVSDGTALVEEMQGGILFSFLFPVNSEPLLTPAWGQSQLQVAHPGSRQEGDGAGIALQHKVLLNPCII